MHNSHSNASYIFNPEYHQIVEYRASEPMIRYSVKAHQNDTEILLDFFKKCTKIIEETRKDIRKTSPNLYKNRPNV